MLYNILIYLLNMMDGGVGMRSGAGVACQVGSWLGVLLPDWRHERASGGLCGRVNLSPEPLTFRRYIP